MERVRHTYCAVMVVLFLSAGTVCLAEVPRLVSYRGVLAEQDGRALPDGVHTVRFSIFDASIDGTELASQVRKVHVRRGLYEVQLEADPATPLAEALAGDPRYIEVAIQLAPSGAWAIFTPRQRIATVPYALVASSAGQIQQQPVGFPQHAVVLWDQAVGCGGAVNSCPCGFSLVASLDGRTVRGALPGEAPGDLLGAVGGTGQDGDLMGGSELPAHQHALQGAGTHTHNPFGTGLTRHTVQRVPNAGIDDGGDHDLISVNGLRTDSDGSHKHPVSSEGSGGPHYHSLRSVLFCRKN